MNVSGTKIGLTVLVVLCLAMSVVHRAIVQPPECDTIEIRLSFWGSYEEWSMWKEIVDGFEAENPDITVTIMYTPGNYDDKIRLLLAADAAPDVMLLQDEPFPRYASYGKLADVTDWAYASRTAQEWDALFWPTAAQSFRYKGRVYGVPIWGGNVLVYYNRKMFREMGVEPPSDDWTFDEFVAKGKELTRDTDGDGRFDTFGFALPGWWVYFMPWTYGFGARYLNDDFTDWAFTDDKALEATRFYQDLRFKDRISPTMHDLPNTDESVMFMTGRIGMSVSGPWNSPPLKTAGIDFDVVHVPTGPVGKRFTRVTWDAVCIFDKSPHKEEAWRFVEYCIGYEAQAVVGRYIRSVPALRAASDAFMDPDNGWNEEKFIEAMDYSTLQPITINWEKMSDVIAAEYELLLLNKQSPEDTIRNMAEGMRRDEVFPITNGS